MIGPAHGLHGPAWPDAPTLGGPGGPAPAARPGAGNAGPAAGAGAAAHDVSTWFDARVDIVPGTHRAAASAEAHALAVLSHLCEPADPPGDGGGFVR